MTRNSRILGPLTLATALTACADASRVVAPPTELDIQPQASVANGDPGRRIFVRDQCGGDSYPWMRTTVEVTAAHGH